jgi:hypothetical protein
MMLTARVGSAVYMQPKLLSLLCMLHPHFAVVCILLQGAEKQ